MQRTIATGRDAAGRIGEGQRALSSLRYDTVAVILNGWFVCGLYLDGWAHIHVPSLETFFTPWHGVLYAGYFASALFLAGTLLYRVRHDLSLGSLLTAMPLGYGLSLIGAGIFLFGGVGDLIWHELFGIEANVEALLSPTHLVLALGGTLISTGPLRAAMWRRRVAAGASSRAGQGAAPGFAVTSVRWPAILPALIALTYMLSMMTFFTEYASPLVQTVAAGYSRSFGSSTYELTGLGVASILLQTAFATGLLLFALRRWRLPFGSTALVLTLNAVLMGLMHNGIPATGPLPLVGVALLGGLAADALRLALPPAARWSYRTYAFVQPAILYALYFVALLVYGGGIGWSVHLVGGAVVLAGVVGWLLSYAFLAPEPDLV
jgi:hypothetical protein